VKTEPGWARLELGVGLVALGGVDLLWREIADLVDVIEVEPQTMWRRATTGGWQLDPAPLQWLRSAERPLLSHGVGFPVGGTVPPDLEGVRAAAESARQLGAPHWSEHLSFNQAESGEVFNAGFLLPPVPTEAAVDAAVANIGLYQDQLGLPFLVETPASYLKRTPGDLRDGQFVREVSERADCGILLDLHNVWANELNGRQGVLEFMADLPLERVWELHLAGGLYLDGYYLDAHCGSVPLALLELAAVVVPTLRCLRAIVFESVPESLITLGVTGMRRVLEDLHDLANLPVALTDTVAASRPALQEPQVGPLLTTAERESRLAAYTTRVSEVLPDGDPGATVLRHLTDQARLSLVTGIEPERLGWMLIHLGRERTDALLVEFLASCPASSWPAEESEAFVRWFEDRLSTRAATDEPPVV
jgi:uncharacterized protein (UPF0276 family)